MKSTTKNKLNLPKGHLSWTQIDLWNNRRQEYFKKYFYEQEGYVSKEMIFGKKFATAVQTGDTGGDEVMDFVIRNKVIKYKVIEYQLETMLETELGNIPLLGYLDTAYKEPVDGLREYKTGKQPWTQKRADRHGQITLYALMVYLQHGSLPKQLHLDWLPTEEIDGEISLTGDMIPFTTSRSMGEILEMATIIKRTAVEISNQYNNYLLSIL